MIAGSKHGVEAHLFRVETPAELNLWSRCLVQGSHAAIASAQEVDIRCRWRDQDCRLTLHFDGGLTLKNRASGQLLWQQTYEALRRSADDGERFLWLEFAGEEDHHELDMLGSPKPVVFILHTILSAKLSRAGLLS